MKLSFCFREFRVFRGSLQFLKPNSRKELNNHGKHRIHGNKNGERKSFTALPEGVALSAHDVTVGRETLSVADHFFASNFGRSAGGFSEPFFRSIDSASFVVVFCVSPPVMR